MLDRMGTDDGEHIMRGIAQELVEKLDSMGAVIYPPKDAWGSKDPELVTKWSRTGAVGPQSRRVRYSPVVDPEYLKIVGARFLNEVGAKTLFHCWACSTVVNDGSVRGVVFEVKSGRLAVLAKVTVDCTGDGDVLRTQFNIGSPIIPSAQRPFEAFLRPIRTRFELCLRPMW